MCVLQTLHMKEEENKRLSQRLVNILISYPPPHTTTSPHTFLKELFSTSVFINSSDLRPVLSGTLNRLQLNQLGLSSAVWHAGFVPILQLWVKPRGLYIKPVNSVIVREAN